MKIIQILCILLTVIACNNSPLNMPEREFVIEVLYDLSSSVKSSSTPVEIDEIMSFIRKKVFNAENDNFFSQTNFVVRISTIGQTNLRKYQEFKLPPILPKLLREIRYPEVRNNVLTDIEKNLAVVYATPQIEKRTFLASAISNSLLRVETADHAFIVCVTDGVEDDGFLNFARIMPKHDVDFNEVASKIKFRLPNKKLAGEIFFLNESETYDPVKERSNQFWEYLLTPLVDKVSFVANF